MFYSTKSTRRQDGDSPSEDVCVLIHGSGMCCVTGQGRVEAASQLPSEEVTYVGPVSSRGPFTCGGRSVGVIWREKDGAAFPGFEDGRRGHRPRTRATSGSSRRKEMDFPWSLPEEGSSASPSALAQWCPFQASHLQGCEKVILCCFTPLRLWEIGTAAVEAGQHWSLVTFCTHTRSSLVSGPGWVPASRTVSSVRLLSGSHPVSVAITWEL